jgi:hypothetical protein
MAVRSRGGGRFIAGVDAAGLPLSTFSFAAATGDVNAANIVIAQGKFSAHNNFAGGGHPKQIGDQFRDNAYYFGGSGLGSPEPYRSPDNLGLSALREPGLAPIQW